MGHDHPSRSGKTGQSRWCTCSARPTPAVDPMASRVTRAGGVHGKIGRSPFGSSSTVIFGRKSSQFHPWEPDLLQPRALPCIRGIWAGMHTVRYFDGKTYEWVGLSRQPNIMGKVKRTLGQFTPARWDKDEWHPMLGPWRFIQVLSLCIAFMTVELNTFFLKFCLWIPPRNPVVVYRLILWWLVAIPTIREYNSYLQDRKPVKKVGVFCWLSLAICIVELLICIKFGHGLFPNPMPPWLIIFWGSIGMAFVIFLLVWSWRIHQTRLKKRQ